MNQDVIRAIAIFAGLLSGVTTFWNGYTIPLTYIGTEDLWTMLVYIIVPLFATVSLFYVGIHKLLPA